MPIYEYVCHSCGREFEKIQGWSDGAPACVACGSEDVARRISPPAIHFKGSGWYITDSKNGKGKNGANSVAGTNGASNNGDSESSGEGSGEKSKAAESSNESGSASKSEGSSSTKSAKDSSKTKSAA